MQILTFQVVVEKLTLNKVVDWTIGFKSSEVKKCALQFAIEPAYICERKCTLTSGKKCLKYLLNSSY